MIKFKKGDILKAEEKVIIHQTNCLGIMGGGLAKQIREQHPKVYKEYKKLCDSVEDTHQLLGTWQSVEDDDVLFINMFSQHNVSNCNRMTNYLAFATALADILSKANQDVAIPKFIGCGLANGDWNVVMNLIDILSIDFKYDIVIYEFTK